MNNFVLGFIVGATLSGSILFFYVSQSVEVVVGFWIVIAILVLFANKIIRNKKKK